MFRFIPTNTAFIITVIFIIIWHCTTMYICRRLSPDNFDYRIKYFTARKWEQNGKWYNKYLKINKWKDLLPQFVSNGGFSKEHIEDNPTIEYIDTFIMETCRGEWDHSMNCLCCLPVILLNPNLMGIVLSFCILIGNLPFSIIQRYNRFRLLTVRKKLLRDKQRQAKKENQVTNELVFNMEA